MKILTNLTQPLRRALVLLLLPVMLFPGQTGKLVGKVTDKKTGEPVIGVSVMLQGTKLGASTDFEGEYIISNIPPGTYTVTVTSLGYKTATIRNVIMKIDLTTTIDVKVEESVVEGDEVVIVAERQLVQKDLTSTSVTVSADEMKVMPVENLSQVINLQAGVVGGHFRGGRTGEVAYLVDGIPVNNPINGGAGMVPENSSVREMEVISGTFNAEYGQAMSGIVNIVTQDGASELHGSFGAYFGDHVTNNTDVFQHLDHLKLFATQNYTFSLSGPVSLVDGMSFFVTGRKQDEEGYLYGRRIYNITDDRRVVLVLPDNTEISFDRNTGNGAYVAMNPYHRYSGNAKLSQALGDFKLSYNAFYEKANWKGYDHNYMQAPDGIMSHYSENWMQNFQINHVIGANTFQALKFSANRFTGKGYLYEDPYDPRYVSPYQGEPETPNTFRAGGNQGGRYENKATTLVGQWTFASQLTKEHKIAMGVEGRMHDLYDHGTGLSTVISLTDTVYKPSYPALGTIGNQFYSKKPYELSGYIQDKMEYGIMIINAGIRFDYFNPNAQLLADLKNPTRNHLFDSVYGVAGTMVDAKEKIQVSPRLGVSFPITDKGIIHFSYGHFFQIPSFGNLYTNSDYLVEQSTRLQNYTGNPDLDAQRTVMYELGVQQELFTNIGIDFTVYYRDIRNLLGTEIIETHEGFKYARYVNRDYGNVRGFIFSMEKRYSDYYSMRADYTYQIAEGNASDPLSVFYNNQSDPPLATNKKVVPLDWDQRSTLNVTLNVGDQGNWMTGLIFGYGMGFPYTENIRVSNGLRFENGGLKPSTYSLDFRADKSFEFFGVRGNVFLLVYNLLDIKNEYNVDNASGRANRNIFLSEVGEIRGLNTYSEWLNNPTSFSAPRNVRIGVNLDY